MPLDELHLTGAPPQGLELQTSDTGPDGKPLQLRLGRVEEISREFPPRTRAIDRVWQHGLLTAVLLMRLKPAGQEGLLTGTARQSQRRRPNASIRGGTRTSALPIRPAAPRRTAQTSCRGIREEAGGVQRSPAPRSVCRRPRRTLVWPEQFRSPRAAR